jgi:hypothetical protein
MDSNTKKGRKQLLYLLRRTDVFVCFGHSFNKKEFTPYKKEISVLLEKITLLKKNLNVVYIC